MKIFRRGRVQALIADECSRKTGLVRFQTALTSLEFPAADLIWIDPLSNERAGLALSTALPLGFGGSNG